MLSTYASEPQLLPPSAPSSKVKPFAAFDCVTAPLIGTTPIAPTNRSVVRAPTSVPVVVLVPEPVLVAVLSRTVDEEAKPLYSEASATAQAIGVPDRLIVIVVPAEVPTLPNQISTSLPTPVSSKPICFPLPLPVQATFDSLIEVTVTVGE